MARVCAARERPPDLFGPNPRPDLGATVCRRSELAAKETRLRALFTPARSAVRAAAGTQLASHETDGLHVSQISACCCSAHPEIITGFRSLINHRCCTNSCSRRPFPGGVLSRRTFCVMICWLQRRVSADRPAINHGSIICRMSVRQQARCTRNQSGSKHAGRNTPTKLGIWS